MTRVYNRLTFPPPPSPYAELKEKLLGLPSSAPFSNVNPIVAKLLAQSSSNIHSKPSAAPQFHNPSQLLQRHSKPIEDQHAPPSKRSTAHKVVQEQAQLIPEIQLKPDPPIATEQPRDEQQNPMHSYSLHCVYASIEETVNEFDDAVSVIPPLETFM